MKGPTFLAAAVLVALLVTPSLSAQTAYQYRRLGNPSDAKTQTSGGLALLGGGPDIDAAVRWMCERYGHGDFLVLGARPSETGQAIGKLCNANSVGFLMIPDRCLACLTPSPTPI
jgi:cyanophycinase